MPKKRQDINHLLCMTHLLFTDVTTMFSLLATLYLLRNLIGAVLVYDCASSKTKITEISLKDVKECEEVPSNYDDGSIINVQIIKKVDTHHFEALLCYVKLSLSTSYCGSGMMLRLPNLLQHGYKQIVLLTKIGFGIRVDLNLGRR